jgi:hypothetical protein
MAIVPGTKKILKSDLPQAPSWFTPVISVLNGFMDVVIRALRGNLSFVDNFYCEIKEFEFTHGTELEILHEKIRNFYGTLLIKTPDDLGVDGFRVRKINQNTVGIIVYFTGGAGTGTCKFILLGA